MKFQFTATLWMVLTVYSFAGAEESSYHGTWKTTNRSLDGSMTCHVTTTDKEQWQGRFFGTWQGVDFDYTVKFTGPAHDLRGTATIDGAAYNWRAWITRDRFRANFSGDRYSGSFELLRKEGSTSNDVVEQDGTGKNRPAKKTSSPPNMDWLPPQDTFMGGNGRSSKQTKM